MIVQNYSNTAKSNFPALSHLDWCKISSLLVSDVDYRSNVWPGNGVFVLNFTRTEKGKPCYFRRTKRNKFAINFTVKYSQLTVFAETWCIKVLKGVTVVSTTTNANKKFECSTIYSVNYPSEPWKRFWITNSPSMLIHEAFNAFRWVLLRCEGLANKALTVQGTNWTWSQILLVTQLSKHAGTRAS